MNVNVIKASFTSSVEQTKIDAILVQNGISFSIDETDDKSIISSPVTTISDGAFSNITGLTSIIVGEGVTSIGKYAFQNNTSLQSVELPSTVILIDDYTFDGCPSLHTITLPSSLAGIGEFAFRGCVGLTQMVLPNTVSTIGTNAFIGCTNLTSVNISNSIAAIGDYVFKNCSKLTNVVFPDSVISIGQQSFYGCSAITILTFPNALVSIGASAFESCSLLHTITMPISITSIGTDAFKGCPLNTINTFSSSTLSYSYNYPSSPTKHVLPSYTNSPIILTYSGTPPTKAGYSIVGQISYLSDTSITSISNDLCLNNTTLLSVSIGIQITTIGSNAFKGCTNLLSVSIPASITSIGSYAFDACSQLKYIYVTDTTSTILNNAFSNCPLLEKMYLPSTLLILPNELFKGCSKLKAIIYSSLATTISNSVFENCSLLQDFVIDTRITTIGNNAFKGSGIKSIVIPNNVTTIGTGVLNSCTSLTSVVIGNSVTSLDSTFFTGDTMLASVIIGNSVTSISPNLFKNCANLETIIIGGVVATIGISSFENCSKLKNISLPIGVIQIQNYAFSNSGLTTIFIPTTVIAIGSYVFAGCSHLESIILTHNILTIGPSTFSNCIKLKSCIIPPKVQIIEDYLFENCSDLIGVIIPNGATTIGNHAFNMCSSIVDLTIPNTVTVLESYAFSSCSNLLNFRIPLNVMSVNAHCFFECSALNTVTIYSNNVALNNTAFLNCTNFDAVYISKNSIYSPLSTNATAKVYFSTFYNNVEIKYIVENTNIRVDMPLTLNLDGAVETFAETIVDNNNYDFFLEEQPINTDGSIQNNIISVDTLKAALRYLQVADVTTTYLADTSAKDALSSSINRCVVEDRFMLTENKIAPSIGYNTTNLVKYPNAIVAPDANLSLTEHWISFLASAFFKSPVNRAPLSNILSIKSQFSSGLNNETIGEQFLRQINPGNNAYILRHIFEQMISQDPIRFTEQDDISSLVEYEESTGIPFPFKPNDIITFNVDIVGNIKTQGIIPNTSYGITKIKNIVDVLRSFTWAQPYFQTTPSENLVTILPKRFKIQLTVGPELKALTDMPYADSNAMLYIPDNDPNFVFTGETMMEGFTVDSNGNLNDTVSSTAWNTGNTYTPDPVKTQQMKQSADAKSDDLMIQLATDYMSSTGVLERFANCADMISFVTYYLTIFCTVFDVLKNTDYNDIKTYAELMQKKKLARGISIGVKDIITILPKHLLNLTKGIIKDVRKAVVVMVNSDANAIKKIVKVIKTIASIVVRVSDTILEIMHFELLDSNTPAFVTPDTDNPTDMKDSSDAEDTRSKINSIRNEQQKKQGTVKQIKTSLGAIYDALSQIKQMRDVAKLVLIFDPKDFNAGSVPAIYYPDPIKIGNATKKVISSARSLQGKKNFQLFMGIMDFVCDVNGVLLSLLDLSSFNLNDFLKLIQFKQMEHFIANTVNKLGGYIDGAEKNVIRLTTLIQDDAIVTIDEMVDNLTSLDDFSSSLALKLVDLYDDINADNTVALLTDITIGNDTLVAIGDTVSSIGPKALNYVNKASSLLTNAVDPSKLLSQKQLNSSIKKAGKTIKKFLKI